MPTPDTDKKTAKVVSIMMSSPGAPYNPDQGGSLSFNNVIKEIDPSSILAKGVEKTIRKKKGAPLNFSDLHRSQETAEDNWQKAISPSAKKAKKHHDTVNLIDTSNPANTKEEVLLSIGQLASINESSTISAVEINDVQLAIADRSFISKKEQYQTRPSIHFQTIIANSIDKTLGRAKSYYCIDLDHISQGKVSRKAGPSGKHVMPTESDVVIEKQLKFNDYVEVISWSNQSVSHKSKISSCFSSLMVPASDGTEFQNMNIKERLLEIFHNSDETDFLRSSSNGESFIRRHNLKNSFGVSQGFVYIEALKENSNSHIINTFYPIVFFPQAHSHSISALVKIASEISTLGNAPLELSYEEFTSIFKESLRVFIEHVDAMTGSSPSIKPPIRYKSNSLNTYIIDGSLGLHSRSLSFLPSQLAEFFTEGFYGEFQSSEINAWLQEISTPHSADFLMNLKPSKSRTITP